MVNANMLNVIMRIVIILSGTILIIVMLSVVAQSKFIVRSGVDNLEYVGVCQNLFHLKWYLLVVK